MFSISAGATAFFDWLNEQGPAAWTQGTDSLGNPTFVTQPYQDYQLSALPNTDSTVVNGNQNPQQFQFDGESYNIVGTVTTTLAYKNDPVWSLAAPVGLIETVPLANLAWSSLLAPIGSAFVKGIQACVSSAPTVGSTAEASTAAETAAEAAVVDGEVVGDSIVDVATGGVALVGLVVLLAIPFLLRRPKPTIYHNVNVYNLTPYPFQFQVLPQNGTQLTLAPAEVAPYSLGGITWESPPGGAPVQVAHEASVALTNSGEAVCIVIFEGLDMVLGAQFNITRGSQKLSVIGALGPNITLKFPQVEATYGSAATVANTAWSSNFTITATYGDADGHSPAPVSGASNAYVANSTVVLSVASVASQPILVSSLG